MAIELFKHNKDAYNSALKMLNTNGKAAIIHPTGTGKFFIGFKLCEDFPEKLICWLSPSDYIFKTQLENLKKASGGYEPQNVNFFTYAKLMNMDENEIADIKCENGFMPGVWIRSQRKNKEKLTSQQIEKLDSINMIWD